MKTIPLDKGMCALVDDIDFQRVQCFHWRAWRTSGGKYYARTSVQREGNQVFIFMHRLIGGTAENQHVDHWNGQTLDNRRQNLRPCSVAQNIANSKKWNTNTSGFKGVAQSRDKWRAYIGDSKGRTWKHLGHFEDPKEAARAYDQAATSRYGEFALTNQKLGLL